MQLADAKKTQREQLDPDNPSQELIHLCHQKSQRILNPIIDWSDEDIWEFIKENSLEYPALYEEGFKRIGCIGCPLAGTKQQRKEFARWPKYQKAYDRAFEQMLEERRKANLKCEWSCGQEVMEWWLDN